MSPTHARIASAATALMFVLFASATHADDWGWTMQGSPVQSGGQLLVSEDGTRVDLMGGFDGLDLQAGDGVWAWSWSEPQGWRRRRLIDETGSGGTAIAVDHSRRRFICFSRAPFGSTQGSLWAIRPDHSDEREDMGWTPFEAPSAITLDAEDRLWALVRTTPGSPVAELWWRALSDSGTWRLVGSLPAISSLLGASWHFDTVRERHLFVSLPADSPPSLSSFPMAGGAPPDVYPLSGLEPFGSPVTAFVDREHRRILLASSPGELSASPPLATARLDVISLEKLGAAQQLAVDLGESLREWAFANLGWSHEGLWAISGDPGISIRRAPFDSLGSWRLVGDSGQSPPWQQFARQTEVFVLEDSTSGWLLGQISGHAARDWSWLWRLDLRGAAVRWAPERVAGPHPDSMEISASVYSEDERRVYAVGARSVWSFDLEPRPRWSKLADSGPGYAPASVVFDAHVPRLLAGADSLHAWSFDHPQWRRLESACVDGSSLGHAPQLAYDVRQERLMRSTILGIHANALTDTSCWRLVLPTSGFGLALAPPSSPHDVAQGGPYPEPLPPSSVRMLLMDERRAELHLDGGIHTWYFAPVSLGYAIPLRSAVLGARLVSGPPLPARNGHAVALTPACDRLVLALGQRVWTWPAGGDDLSWSIPSRPAQESDRVSLAWHAVTSFQDPVTLWRRTPAEDWQAIATLSPDAGGAMAYDDRTATAGQRYGYRLTRSDQITDLASRDQWLTRETRAEFALHRAWPNPTSGRLTLSFALARPGAARFEVFDLSGRRVWLETRDAQPGQQLATLDLPATLRTGVYLLRVASGGERRSARIALIR